MLPRALELTDFSATYADTGHGGDRRKRNQQGTLESCIFSFPLWSCYPFCNNMCDFYFSHFAIEVLPVWVVCTNPTAFKDLKWCWELWGLFTGLESVSCGPMTRRGHAAQRKEQLKQQKELFSIPLYLIFLMIHIKHSTYASILFSGTAKRAP